MTRERGYKGGPEAPSNGCPYRDCIWAGVDKEDISPQSSFGTYDRPLKTTASNAMTTSLANRNQAFICLIVHGVSEFIATFVLLLAVMACFALLIVPFVAKSLQTTALACLVGLAITLIVKSPIGKLSGAHMNPAVSFAFWLERRMTAKEFLVYIVMQFVGAITACELLFGLIFKRFEAIGFGVLRPAPGLSLTRLLALEAGATGGLIVLMFYILSHKDLTRHAAAAIGIYIALMTYLLVSLTGAGLNPARAYGAALVAYRLDGQWPYFVAPLFGAATAVILYRLAPFLPRPLFHRLNHCHRHSNYTMYFINQLRQLFRTI